MRSNWTLLRSKSYTTRGTKSGQRWRFERLESRQLLSVSPAEVLPGDLESVLAAGEQHSAQIAAGDTGYLAVWTDVRSSLLGGSMNSGPYFGPAIGSMTDVYAARLDASGNLIDTAPLPISTAPYNQSSPVVGWNGQDWLVAWASERETDRYQIDVVATRVSTDGQILDPTPIVLATAPTSIDYYQPYSMSSDGTNWAVVWRGLTGGVFTLRGGRVSPSGSLLDPGGKTLRQDTFNSAPHSADLAFAGDEYLMTWLELGGGSDVLKGQRLSTTLNPIGSRFTVNTLSPSDPVAPKVASDGNSFFVTWFEDRYQGFAQAYGARISHGGAVLDPAGIALTGYLDYTQISPDVVWDGTQWIVAYPSAVSISDYDILGTRVTSAGTVLDPNGIVFVSASSYQDRPSLAARPGGGAQLVWTDPRAAGNDAEDVYTVSISGAGVAGAEQGISLGTRRESLPRTAAGANGFVTVYRAEGSTGTRILAQRLGSLGQPLDPEPIVVADGPVTLNHPSVAWNGSEYLVVWEDAVPATFNPRGQVMARRLLPDGTLLDAASVMVMQGNTPDVSAVGTTFLVVATDTPTNPQLRQTYAVRVDELGQVLSSPVQVGSNHSRYPRVASLSDRWLVTWQQHATHDNPRSNVYARFVHADGSAGVQVAATANSGFNARPHLASSGTDALLVWEDNDIFGRRIQSDGTLGPTLTVSNASEGQFAPSVAWDGTQYVVNWVDFRNEVYPDQQQGDVFAARVGATGTVLDPSGFAIADSALPEDTPTVAAAGGLTVLSYATMQPGAPYSAWRITQRVMSAAPVPTASVADVSSFEGQVGSRTFTIYVALSSPADHVVNIQVATSDGTATAYQDYEPVDNVVTFEIGETLRPLSITVHGDTVREANEWFAVNLFTTGGVNLADPLALAHIVNDDLSPIVDHVLARLADDDEIDDPNPLPAFNQTRREVAPVTASKEWPLFVEGMVRSQELQRSNRARTARARLPENLTEPTPSLTGLKNKLAIVARTADGM